jgi:hypothetical protein
MEGVPVLSWSWSWLAEEGLDVYLEEIVTDPASDDPTVCLEGISVAGAHGDRHLEGNVDELPELKFILRSGGIVVERHGEIPRARCTVSSARGPGSRPGPTSGSSRQERRLD